MLLSTESDSERFQGYKRVKGRVAAMGTSRACTYDLLNKLKPPRREHFSRLTFKFLFSKSSYNCGILSEANHFLIVISFVEGFVVAIVTTTRLCDLLGTSINHESADIDTAPSLEIDGGKQS